MLYLFIFLLQTFSSGLQIEVGYDRWVAPGIGLLSMKHEYQASIIACLLIPPQALLKTHTQFSIGGGWLHYLMLLAYFPHHWLYHLPQTSRLLMFIACSSFGTFLHPLLWHQHIDGHILSSRFCHPFDLSSFQRFLRDFNCTLWTRLLMFPRWCFCECV